MKQQNKITWELDGSWIYPVAVICRKENFIMANLSFDFSKIKRSFFHVKLKDGRDLVVKMPMKKTFEKIASLQEMDENEMSIDDALDTLGGLCAEALSNNMTSERVDTKYMTDNYDLEEMQVFLENYYNFAGGVKSNPN